MVLPLTLVLPLDQQLSQRTPRQLLVPCIEAALRGLLTGSISIRYAELTMYWHTYKKEHMSTAGREIQWERILMDVEEAFEPLVETLDVYVEYLRNYGRLDNLIIDVLGLDPTDGTVIVRISDGRENNTNPRRRNLQGVYK
ncbi:hypothetical protein D3C86_989060 [compost metagenome]